MSHLFATPSGRYLLVGSQDTRRHLPDWDLMMVVLTGGTSAWQDAEHLHDTITKEDS
jgi:hypothetical protein